MKAIRIPKEDRYIFLEAARRMELEFTRLKKMPHPTLEFFHTDKFNLSQDDLFKLGILFQKLKTAKILHHDNQ